MQRNDGGCDCWEGHAAVVLTLCADEMTQPLSEYLTYCI